MWYVVCTRCEIDLNGFESVFDQLVDEDGVAALIQSLELLDASRLAALFSEAAALLKSHRVFAEAKFCADLPESVRLRLTQIGEDVQRDDALWELDSALAKLIQ